MFDDKLSAQMERQKTELSGVLYRHYTLLRDLDKVKEDLARMEAGLAELERVKKEWDTHKAIEEAQAKETEDNE